MRTQNDSIPTAGIREEPAPWQRICSCNSFSIHCRECRRTCRGKVGVIPMEEGLSMQLSTALLLCIIILGLTGGLAPLQALFRIRPFHAVYFAVCMLAFSSFVFAPVAQLRFSLQIVMLPISLALWAWHERPNPGAPAALLFFSLAAFFAGRTELLAGTQNGLLTGCIAGAAATVLVTTPRTALAVVCLVPVVCALGEGCVNLVTGSYGILDFASAALADAQMSGLCFGAILLCLYQVAQEQKRSAE